MKSILLTLLIFAIIILIHEFGHFITARLSGVKVNEFAIGMGPTLFRFGKGETRYALRLLPIGGFVSMEGEDGESEDGRAFCNQKVWKRILIVCAGAIMNLVLGFVIVLSLTIPKDAIATHTVAEFYDGAATEASGLQVGDEILKINDHSIWIESDIVYELSYDEDGVVDLLVRRDGEKLLLSNITFGKNGSSLIIDFKVKGEPATFGRTLSYAFRRTASIGRLVWISLGDLITGNASVNDLSGPIGTAQVIGEASSAGLSTVMTLFAFITINVGIFNLLPVPALDGGRLIFLLIEAITRRRVKPELEAWIHFAGFVLVMALVVFVSYHDIVKLIKG